MCCVGLPPSVREPGWCTHTPKRCTLASRLHEMTTNTLSMLSKTSISVWYDTKKTRHDMYLRTFTCARYYTINVCSYTTWHIPAWGRGPTCWWRFPWRGRLTSPGPPRSRTARSISPCTWGPGPSSKGQFDKGCDGGFYRGFGSKKKKKKPNTRVREFMRVHNSSFARVHEANRSKKQLRSTQNKINSSGSIVQQHGYATLTLYIY